MVAFNGDDRNTAVLSQHIFPAAETVSVRAWRKASNALCTQVHSTTSYMESFIQCGGPEAIKSLKATIKKLQLEVEEEKACGQVQRYRALQQDLKQRDAVCDALRGLLKAKCGMADADIDKGLDAKALKQDLLYGASREHLLRENKVLRAALESCLITPKTAAPATQPLRLCADGNIRRDSRTPAEGAAHMAALLQAAKRLDEAEQAHTPPAMRAASTQADDGACTLINMLEARVNTLGAQKAQLLQKVAEGASALALCQRRAEAAESELTDVKRQKTELLFHQGDMSKEIRSHLTAETARAERAEVAAAEAARAMQAAKEDASAARTEAEILRTVLTDKDMQVQRLREQQDSMRDALLAAMDGLAQAQARQQEASGCVAEEVRAAHKDYVAQLGTAIATLQDLCRAAVDSTQQTASLAARQEELVDKIGGEREVASRALAVLEAQLSRAHHAASQAEQERQRLQHQIIASSLLGRHQDRRHDEALQALRGTSAVVKGDHLWPPSARAATPAAATTDNKDTTVVAAGPPAAPAPLRAGHGRVGSGSGSSVGGGRGGEGEGRDLLGQDTQTVLDRSAALRVALEVLASSPPALVQAAQGPAATLLRAAHHSPAPPGLQGTAGAQQLAAASAPASRVAGPDTAASIPVPRTANPDAAARVTRPHTAGPDVAACVTPRATDASACVGTSDVAPRPGAGGLLDQQPARQGMPRAGQGLALPHSSLAISSHTHGAQIKAPAPLPAAMGDVGGGQTHDQQRGGLSVSGAQQGQLHSLHGTAVGGPARAGPASRDSLAMSIHQKLTQQQQQQQQHQHQHQQQQRRR